MLQNFLERAIPAVHDAMEYIRAAQLFPSRVAAGVKHADGTLVTATDKEAERVLHARLQGIQNTCFRGEEGTASGGGGYTIMVDPLDGTRAFALRLATSTVIAALTHPERGVVACVIGEPSTGRIWSATEDSPTRLYPNKESATPAQVWPGELDAQASVFMDVSHGFTRGPEKRQILTDDQVHRLMVGVSKTCKLFMPGSNGLHFALVANGSDRMAGQITTAVGGPWDIAGVLLVLQAGGAARGFSVTDGKLTEQNPLHIEECDIMVSGNSVATVDRLVDLLLASL